MDGTEAANKTAAGHRCCTQGPGEQVYRRPSMTLLPSLQ